MNKFYTPIFVFIFCFLSHAQIISFSGPDFKYRLTQAHSGNTIAKNLAGDYFKIDANNDLEIQVSEALNVSELNLDGYTAAVGNNLIGISYFTNLITLDCHYNSINSLDLTNLVNLNELDCSSNQMTSLVLSPSNTITKLNCRGNQLVNIDTSNLSSLIEFDCSGTLISSLILNSHPNLTKLHVANTPLLTVPINLSTVQSLTDLDVSNSGFSSIDLSSLVNLKFFSFEGNSATSIDFSNNPNLELIAIRWNLISDINVSNLMQLKYLYLDGNNLTTLNLSNNPLLLFLFCQHNNITSLDLSNNHQLYEVFCGYNLLTSLDLGNCSNLHVVNAFYNQLNFINLKNGSNEYIDVQGNPDLTYVCVDDFDSNSIYYLYNNGYNFNSYCTFTPGGNYYTIQGSQKFDSNINGCDSNDVLFPNLNFNITDGFSTGNIIANTSGDYSIFVGQGTHTITPILENPTYFNVAPSSLQVTLPNASNPTIQNFCITPNGVHNDLEVVIIPLFPARPGFDATYKILYKNKGNTTLSGSVVLDFEDNKMDFVSSTPSYTSISTGELIYNYSDLAPFEIREIIITMNINSPTETPAVNIGDQLSFIVNINPLSGDEYVQDNRINFKQTVVGSYDPNDKTCIEGDVVGAEVIGNYIHYVIRFENTGTFPAENIVVKDIIDATKFDINTLTPTSSSHPFVTKISNGTIVEFIFENIQLPFDDANNDGYLAFKIKTLPSLSIGDTFSNNANIYFDYNFPIETNTTLTTIQNLNKPDFEFTDYITLYPNPANSKLNFKLKKDIDISSVNIYNSLGQLVIVATNPNEFIDVSELKTGSYFVKIISNLGLSNCQFLKE